MFEQFAEFIAPIFSSMNIEHASLVLFSKIFLLAFAISLFNYLLGTLGAWLLHRARATAFPWDDAALEAGLKPARLLVWIYGFAYVLHLLDEHTTNELFSKLAELRLLATLIIIGWFLIRLVRRLEVSFINKRQREDRPIDQVTVTAIGKLLRIAIIITIGLSILQSFGVSISGVLAFGGIGGIAVGFAAKDMLANFFGAFIIYFDRPFAVGDWVRSPNQDIEGVVEEIGWRMTRIRRFNKCPLYVPNAVFTHITVENPSRMSHRRIKEHIGIRYDDLAKMQVITDDIRNMLNTHQDIDASQTLIVQFDAFNASSVDILVYTFTKTVHWVRYQEVRQDVFLKIANIISAHGAEIAFPTTTVHAPKNTGQDIADVGQ